MILPRRIVDSLALRIALLLSAGMLLAVAASLLIAQRLREADFLRFQDARVLASAQDIALRLRRAPASTIDAMARDEIIGARLFAQTVPSPVDAMLTAELRQRLGGGTPMRLGHADRTTCRSLDPFLHHSRTAGFGRPVASDCWLLTTIAGGRRLSVSLDLPILPKPPSVLADPVFVALLCLTCLSLSLVAGRVATRPLRRLTQAARAFAGSIDAEPVAERGPADVREALATFNLMQRRVRSGVRERTRLLAAIGHDLQTPLTRLRLRLEEVADESLRARLVDDLSATLRMVRRGLDLARSGESHEPWAMVDLDSLLSSIADDASAYGHAVRMTAGCRARVRAKPDALTRCLGNLVDNAIKYAGGAELSCRRHGDQLIVQVRDHGPGIAPELLPRAFEPFVRGDTAADGSGIGLAIARAQAAAVGGTLELRNHPSGGLEATIALPALIR
ncbi:ATP-binding protein [Sphingomonas sp. RIT328]|uniref:ATP-binding protein n=1 Tax=Sphingomonas sp. RIT328 TaxID=1470591 RepID=UPI00044B6358|nr:ATP-binding protein [Sphingomonas sp. RIT328]EZP54181.1 putative histidine kinase-like ATPase [Sphingomonas sp. RIT328]